MKLRFLIFVFVFSLSATIKVPSHHSTDLIVTHTGFSIDYDPSFKQAKWVSYLLTRDHLKNQIIKRTNNFRSDSLLPSKFRVSPNNFYHSGYDRGHLCPAEDMRWNEKAENDCFYMSNISPQVPAFNRGIWERLENLVRKWAIDFDSEYVVTGGVLKKGLKKIGPDSVSVPDYFYKVILVYRAKDKKGIGFILKNEKNKKVLIHYAVSIDSVEKVAGIKFFPGINDSLKNKIRIGNWWRN
jgi:endonuclease G